MNLASATCPICGAKILTSDDGQNFTCRFCLFERRPALDAGEDPASSLEISFQDLVQIQALQGNSGIHMAKIHVDDLGEKSLIRLQKKYQTTLAPNAKYIQNIDCIWSHMTLPFQENLAGFFTEKFRQLKPGGMLYISTPVRRPLQKNSPLAGQINFFRSKNIMFLLEQHGFKMAWRKNRFSSVLRIIARRN